MLLCLRCNPSITISDDITKCPLQVTNRELMYAALQAKLKSPGITANACTPPYFKVRGLHCAASSLGMSYLGVIGTLHEWQVADAETSAAAMSVQNHCPADVLNDHPSVTRGMIPGLHIAEPCKPILQVVRQDASHL